MPTAADRYLSDVPIGMLQPNVILPVQHTGVRKPLAPEQRLMVAVFLDAINCMQKYRRATDHRGQRIFDEVRQWLGAKETDWPYSFESICEVLGLDANTVRCRLGMAQDQQPLLATRQMGAARQDSRRSPSETRGESPCH